MPPRLVSDTMDKRFRAPPLRPLVAADLLALKFPLALVHTTLRPTHPSEFPYTDSGKLNRMDILAVLFQKLNVDKDLIVWTRHFTTFTTYTETNNRSVGSSGSFIQKDFTLNDKDVASPLVAISSKSNINNVLNQNDLPSINDGKKIIKKDIGLGLDPVSLLDNNEKVNILADNNNYLASVGKITGLSNFWLTVVPALLLILLLTIIIYKKKSSQNF